MTWLRNALAHIIVDNTKMTRINNNNVWSANYFLNLYFIYLPYRSHHTGMLLLSVINRWYIIQFSPPFFCFVFTWFPVKMSSDTQFQYSEMMILCTVSYPKCLQGSGNIGLGLALGIQFSFVIYFLYKIHLFFFTLFFHLKTVKGWGINLPPFFRYQLGHYNDFLCKYK